MGGEGSKFASASNVVWLDAAVQRYTMVVKKTTPLEIVGFIQTSFAETISFKVAKQCRLCIFTDGKG